MFYLYSMVPRRPIRRPRRVPNPNGKEARQMLMGMALGWHVVSQWITKVHFMVKTRLEAQVLFVLLAPFLAIPTIVIAIPFACMAVTAMTLAGVSSTVTKFSSVRTMMDREQLRRLERQSGVFHNDAKKAALLKRNRMASKQQPTTAIHSLAARPPRPARMTRSRTFTFTGSFRRHA